VWCGGVRVCVNKRTHHDRYLATPAPSRLPVREFFDPKGIVDASDVTWTCAGSAVTAHYTVTSIPLTVRCGALASRYRAAHVTPLFVRGYAAFEGPNEDAVTFTIPPSPWLQPSTVSSLPFGPLPSTVGTPTFYRGALTIPGTPTDTYLRSRGFTKASASLGVCAAVCAL
jgi:hypothetical protein